MKSTSKSQLIIPIASIVLGILFFIFPTQILNFLFYVVGCIIIVYGIIALIYNIKNYDKTLPSYNALIVIDCLVIVLGTLFIALSYWFQVVFVIILGISFFLLGFYGVYAALVDPSLTTINRVIKLIVCALDCVIGIMMFIRVNQTLDWIMYVLGALLIANGITLLVSYGKAIHDEKAFKDAQEKEAKKAADNIIDVEVKEEN